MAAGSSVTSSVLDERVAAALHEVVTRLSARQEDLARAIIERIAAEVPDYKMLDREFLDEDVYGVTYDNLTVIFESFVARTPAPEAALDSTRRGAARRVHQGVALKSFMRAVQLWGQAVWQGVVDVTDPANAAEREAALVLAGDVLRHMDQAAVAAAEGYLDELQARMSDHEVLRRDLLDDLIAGNGDSDRVRRLARSLKLPLADGYVVVLVRGEDVAGDDDVADVPLAARVAMRRLVDAARQKLRPPDGSLLVGMRGGEVVALYPVKSTAGVDVLHAQATELAQVVAERNACVGVGGGHPGIAAVALSYSEAREAVEIALGTGVLGRPVVFDEVLIDALLRSSPHPGRILDASVQPLLTYDAEREAELVPTLRAYLASGFNLTRSAELLCVHPNTVVYRLRRIRELSGRDPANPDDLLLLLLGLKLADLGG